MKNALWISRFFEGPAVVQRLQSRWAEINEELIPSMFTWISDTEKLLGPSATENFDKWKILGKEIWPKVNGFETRTTYKSEVDYMVQWLHDRIDWMNETIPTL